MRITVLGCGSSNGVPHIGGRWGDCDPNDPRNRRSRPSVLVETDGGATILIDTSPDLREQLLAARVERLDAVLWTHAHADHVHGIDDLREICRLMAAPVRVFGLAEHLVEISRRFDYAFAPLPEGHGYYRPVLDATVIDGPFSVGDVLIEPFVQDHGWMSTLGYRVGAFAYSTDVVRLDDEAFARLSGIDTWIVDCVRREPHPVHSHLAQTLGWIERVRPKRAYLTHMGNTLDYANLAAELPPGVAPAHDGLVVNVP